MTLTYHDPVTLNVFTDDDRHEQQQHWSRQTDALVARLPEADAAAMCQLVYAFLDEASRGQDGMSPQVPLCDHAIHSYVTDHALLVSAIVYCMGHTRDDIDILRLGALTHEFPHYAGSEENIRSKILEKVPPDQQGLLKRAWDLLDDQAQHLEQALETGQHDAAGSLGRFLALTRKPTDDLVLLYHAHLAASATLGDMLLEREGQERWVPASKGVFDQHPLASAKDKIGLVYGGATKIKGYVFESAKLPEIRGASGLLDRINLVDMPALFGRVAKDEEGGKERFEHVRDKYGPGTDAPECIIYANGGNILALAPASLVGELAHDIERLYTEETLVANNAAVGDCFTLLELQYGLGPTEYWLQEYQGDLKKAASVLQAYYGEPKPGEDEKAPFLRRKVFGELTSRLAGDFNRRREGNREENQPQKAIPHFETLPFARRCTSCDRRVAVCHTEVGGDERFLCEPCARKSWMGQLMKKGKQSGAQAIKKCGFSWEPGGEEETQTWVERFQEYLETTGQHSSYYGELSPGEVLNPDDLEDIGGVAEPEGFIGVVYGDGNSLGAIIKEIGTPAEHRQFANRVYQALQAAVWEAIRTHLPPCRLADRRHIHPFEVLSIGGDDVFLIVPGDKALPVAHAIAERLERVLGQELHPTHFEHRGTQRYTHYNDQGQEVPRELTYRPKISLSAGVVIAGHHTPVFFLRDLVEDLLKSAKTKAKACKTDYQGGTVDFLTLKSTPMIASGVDEFRKGVLYRETGDDKIWLTARPYTLPELEGLVHTASALKAGLPRSQLHALRNLIFGERLAASISYLYFTGRLNHEDRERLRQHFSLAWCTQDPALWTAPPWRLIKAGEYETVLYDVLEILDFVEEGY